MKCLLPLVLISIILVGCSSKPTEAEFDSLKKANEALYDWEKLLLISIKDGGTSSNRSIAKQLMDGAIIKSEIGKRIRTNLQDAFILINPTEEAINKYDPLYKECIEINKKLHILIDQNRFDEANALREKLKSIAQQTNESKKELQEAVRKYIPLTEKLESERKNLFQKMREELESCSSKPTEAEFDSLKKANEALACWLQGFFITIKTGKTSSSSSIAKQLMDGAIIKSEIGKRIRTNLQDAFMLITPMQGTVNKYGLINNEFKEINKQLRIIIDQDRFDEANALREKQKLLEQQLIESEKEIQEALRKITPLMEKLESERKDLFQKMRAELEK